MREIEVLRAESAQNSASGAATTSSPSESAQSRRCKSVPPSSEGRKEAQCMGQGRLSRRKFERICEVFEEWSDCGKPGSRSMSREALGAQLQRLRPLLTDVDVDNIFRAADADRDGRVGLEEFCDWFGGCRSLHDDVLQLQTSTVGTTMLSLRGST